MVIIGVSSSLSAAKTRMVSSCLRLVGKEFSSDKIDDCLNRDNFTGLSLEDITDIVNYANVIDFIHGCKEQRIRQMNSSVAIALCNFVLRKISIEQSFLRPDLSVSKLESILNDIFGKMHGADSTHHAIRIGTTLLLGSRFIVSDLEAVIYCIINFYLYIYKGEVCVFEHKQLHGTGDLISLYWDLLTEWVECLT